MPVGRSIKRFFRRIFLPYNCKECGKPYRKMGVRDFTPQQIADYKREGLLSFVAGYSYKCDDCNITVMVA